MGLGAGRPDGSTLGLRGREAETTVNGQDYVSKVTIDPKASPRTVNFLLTEGPNDSAGRTVKGIYKIDGDKLSICIASPGRDAGRPNSSRPRTSRSSSS